MPRSSRHDSNKYVINGEIIKAYFNNKKSFIEFYNEISKEDYMDYKDIKNNPMMND